MTKRELGEGYFKNGYNCAQAVALAFEKETGLDKDFIAKALSGYGGGFGRMREVCGAVNGMVFVLNILKGYTSPTNDGEKTSHYKEVQYVMKAFKEKNGSYICRELLSLPDGNSEPTPEKRTQAYYKKRPCALLVGDACEILENYLNK